METTSWKYQVWTLKKTPSKVSRIVTRRLMKSVQYIISRTKVFNSQGWPGALWWRLSLVKRDRTHWDITKVAKHQKRKRKTKTKSCARGVLPVTWSKPQGCSIVKSVTVASRSTTITVHGLVLVSDKETTSSFTSTYGLPRYMPFSLWAWMSDSWRPPTFSSSTGVITRISIKCFCRSWYCVYMVHSLQCFCFLWQSTTPTL